jgi:hypothetical protein
VLSPAARDDHNAILSTRSSTRRALEEIDGVRPRLREAQNGTDLSNLFTTFP